MRTVNGAGQLGTPARLPDLAQEAQAFTPTWWSADGATLHFFAVPEGQPENADGEEPPSSPRGSHWSFDAASGALTPRSEPPRPEPEEAARPSWSFHLETGETPLAPPPGAVAPRRPLPLYGEPKVRPLWLTQGQGAARESFLVAADADHGEVSPRGDAVLYINREGCFVVPLMRLNRAEVEAARRKAEITQLVSNGKQVALAVIMYANDHEDTPPHAGADVRALLQPYTGTPDIFNGLTGPGDGFVYTYPGGRLGDLANPSETEMGFIPAPGGRVVVYMDGHVVFVPPAAPAP